MKMTHEDIFLNVRSAQSIRIAYPQIDGLFDIEDLDALTTHLKAIARKDNCPRIPILRECALFATPVD